LASSHRILRARWLLPIDRPPVDGGWVEIQDGHIVRVGSGRPDDPVTDLGDVALLPGLVNAHTHLELAWMAGRIPPADSMVGWIRSILELRALGTADADATAAMRDAARAMRESGTVLAGDISNTLASPFILREAGIGGVVFHELLGFAVTDPASMVTDAWARVDRLGHPSRRLHFSVVGHAPYSTSPALLSEIAIRRREQPLSIHLAESAGELKLLHDGRGPMRSLLLELGVWRHDWTVPACGPVEYLERLGYLQPGLLAVHGVHLRPEEIERLRDRGSVLVICPRSNEWVGGGVPPVSRFYASGIRIAIGTDSLASVPSLSLFDELAAVRRLAPEVSAANLLASATAVGARALGFDATHGSIAPGKVASLVTVDVPSDVTDVEEFLVSSVPASAIHAM
jgi:aminodeoxyfutalosine deaminase